MITPAAFYGGSYDVTVAVHVIQSWRVARVYRFNHTVAGTYEAHLPTVDEIYHETPPNGGPQFYLVNDGTKTVRVKRRKDATTDSIFLLVTGKAAIITFASGDYHWTIHDIAT